MPVRRIDARGNGLLVSMDTGEKIMAWPIPGDAWLPGKVGSSPNPDPSTFDMVSNDGTLQFTIEQQGMRYARTIFDVGVDVGLPRDGIVCAFMCVMVEAPPFLMYANSNVPDSLNYYHDAVGSDSDSLGLFQQRPSAGWGTVAELMDATYNARAFYGGPTGPNAGNPAGLLDLSNPTWDNYPTLGEAVQAVQVSAFPDRYNNWTEACYQLHDALAGSTPTGNFMWHFDPRPSDEGGDMPPNGSSDQPLAEFGPRELTGSFHEGIDFGYGDATEGATIRATGAGEVVESQLTSGWGNMVLIFHGEVGGRDLYTRHGHMQAAGPAVGSQVALGDALGTVGSTGNVTGPHDHYETHDCAPGEYPVNNINDPAGYRTAIDPRDFHAAHGNEVQP